MTAFSDLFKITVVVYWYHEVDGTVNIPQIDKHHHSQHHHHIFLTKAKPAPGAHARASTARRTYLTSTPALYGPSYSQIDLH